MRRILNAKLKLVPMFFVLLTFLALASSTWALPSVCELRCTYPNTCDDVCCIFLPNGKIIYSTCRAEGYCGFKSIGTADNDFDKLFENTAFLDSKVAVDADVSKTTEIDNVD